MKNFCKSSNSTNGFEKFIYGLIASIFKFIPNKSIRDIANTFFHWEYLDSTELFLSFTNEEDVINFVGKEVVSEFRKNGFHPNEIINKIMEDTSAEDAMAAIPVYFSGKDGFFKLRYDKEKKCFSQEWIPGQENTLAECVLASFAFPILDPVFIKVGGKFIKAFDGGIINNYANLVYQNRSVGESIVSVFCEETPGKKLPHQYLYKGFSGIQDASFYAGQRNFDRTESCRTPVPYKGFFAFDDENIEEHFDQPATELF